MTSRWIGTSWKMNFTLSDAVTYTHTLGKALCERPELSEGIQPFLVPPATALATVHQILGERPRRPGRLKLGVQNAHWEDNGAWTGEISVPQALDAGADIVEIGHSERREFFNETIRTTRLKVLAAIRHGAYPLLCVGEPQEVWDRGQAADYILRQANGALDGLTEAQLSAVLIAYEPMWAIGATGRPATVAQLSEPFHALHERFGGRVECLLYGGSVNRQNAESLLATEHIGGLFIGRSAWTAAGYTEILELASAA